jgi:hypothetical protein
MLAYSHTLQLYESRFSTRFSGPFARVTAYALTLARTRAPGLTAPSQPAALTLSSPLGIEKLGVHTGPYGQQAVANTLPIARACALCATSVR